MTTACASLQQHQPSSAQSQRHKWQLEESKRALEYEQSTTSMSLAQEKRTVEKIKRIEAELRQLDGDPTTRRFLMTKERERLELQEQLQARVRFAKFPRAVAVLGTCIPPRNCTGLRAWNARRSRRTALPQRSRRTGLLCLSFSTSGFSCSGGITKSWMRRIASPKC